MAKSCFSVQFYYDCAIVNVEQGGKEWAPHSTHLFVCLSCFQQGLLRSPRCVWLRCEHQSPLLFPRWIPLLRTHYSKREVREKKTCHITVVVKSWLGGGVMTPHCRKWETGSQRTTTLIFKLNMYITPSCQVQILLTFTWTVTRFILFVHQI